MYRELIDHLAFVYGFICKGRGMMKQGDMEKISGGAHAMPGQADCRASAELPYPFWLRR